jgi:N-acetylmuramoyl-L-alanine amidase
MIRYHRAILSISFAVCVLLCSGTRSHGQAFKWDTVKHNGAEYVTLRGVKDFYFFKKITFGKKITIEHSKVKIEFRSGSQQCRMNGVLFILSSPIVSKGGKYLLSRTDLMSLIDPVLRPKHIQNARPVRTVVVDAGHGGKDSGSLGVLKHEKIYTLKIARLVRDMLQKRRYRVVMTRDSDVFVSLSNRVRIANKYPDAVFLSIHFNSGNSRANGIETFTISPIGVPHMDRGVRPRDFNKVPGNIMGSASIAFATAAHSRTFEYLNNIKHGNNFRIADRGIKRARFNVLTGIKIPAILVEGGFLSNRAEAQKINSIAYQKKLAEALAKSVEIYSNSVSRTKTR